MKIDLPIALLLALNIATISFVGGMFIEGNHTAFWIQRAHEYKTDADRIAQQYYSQFIIKSAYVEFGETDITHQSREE